MLGRQQASGDGDMGFANNAVLRALGLMAATVLCPLAAVCHMASCQAFDIGTAPKAQELVRGNREATCTQKGRIKPQGG